MVAVRAATAADVPALGRLGAMLVARHHEFDAARFIAPDAQTPRHYGRFLASQLERNDRIVLVADDAGEVIGYAYGGLEDADWMILRGPAGAIYDLIVDPDHRRRGGGRALLEALIEQLRDLGAPSIVLGTAERNTDAQRLFAKLGFRPTMIEMTRELQPPRA